MKKVLVAVDGSPPSDKALDFAIGLAKRAQAELIVVNVAEDLCPQGLSEVDVNTIRELSLKESAAVLAAAQARAVAAGVKVRTVSESGSAAEVIDALATKEGVERVVVGSHGKHGVRKFALGSVSGRVAEWAPCTVTIVK
jgi:nucleotide-binding universal stress UspA family protein